MVKIAAFSTLPLVLMLPALFAQAQDEPGTWAFQPARDEFRPDAQTRGSPGHQGSLTRSAELLPVAGLDEADGGEHDSGYGIRSPGGLRGKTILHKGTQ